MDHLASRELWLWKYFFVGIIASELSERYARCLSETKGILLFALGCFLLYLDFKTSPNGAPYDWFNLLHLVPKNLDEYTIGLSLASALILIGSLNAPRFAGWLSIKPLRMIGAISYSLFLIHPFFILAVFPKFDFTKAGQLQVLMENSPAAPPWYAPFVMFPGCLAWAILCFLMIERPFLLLRPKQALVSGDSLSS
jgi:peptidoglycan/LPS O-acetylase OafA/YrhL